MMFSQIILVVMGMIGCTLAFQMKVNPSVNLPRFPQSGLACKLDGSVIPVVLIWIAADGGPIVVVDSNNAAALKEAGVFYLVKEYTKQVETEMTEVKWEAELGEYKGMTIGKGFSQVDVQFDYPILTYAGLDFEDYKEVMTGAGEVKVAYFTVEKGTDIATLVNRVIPNINESEDDGYFKAEGVSLHDIPEGSGIIGKSGLLGFLESNTTNKITAVEAPLMNICKGY